VIIAKIAEPQSPLLATKLVANGGREILVDEKLRKVFGKDKSR
jgi:hypothetical protein